MKDLIKTLESDSLKEVPKKPKFYDINMIFRSDEELDDIDAIQELFALVDLMVTEPDLYLEEHFDICIEKLKELSKYYQATRNNFEQNLNPYFAFEHLYDIYVISEQRLQDLDDYTLSFTLNGYSNLILQEIMICIRSLETIKRFQFNSKAK